MTAPAYPYVEGKRRRFKLWMVWRMDNRVVNQAASPVASRVDNPLANPLVSPAVNPVDNRVVIPITNDRDIVQTVKGISPPPPRPGPESAVPAAIQPEPQPIAPQDNTPIEHIDISIQHNPKSIVKTIKTYLLKKSSSEYEFSLDDLVEKKYSDMLIVACPSIVNLQDKESYAEVAAVLMGVIGSKYKRLLSANGGGERTWKMACAHRGVAAHKGVSNARNRPTDKCECKYSINLYLGGRLKLMNGEHAEGCSEMSSHDTTANGKLFSQVQSPSRLQKVKDETANLALNVPSIKIF